MFDYLVNFDITPLAMDQHLPVFDAWKLSQSLPLPVRIDPDGSPEMLPSTSDSAEVCSDRLSFFAMQK